MILQYLTTNLTNAEIAEAEYISLHTAKTHIAHIYQKLGVSSRRAAIRRAAESNSTDADQAAVPRA